MSSDYPRDMIGYGPAAPDPAWPAGARLALQFVITYEDAVGRPQFRADLRDWELSPKLDDALFRFTPAKDAEHIYFNAGAQILPGVPLEEESR